MGKYNNYQETPYRWLPQVPAHWSQKSIRQITSVLSERCGNRNLRLLSVYREYGVIPKDSRDDNHNKESLDLSNYKVVHVGNLVLNKMKMWQGSLGVSRYKGIVSPAYIICKVLDNDINLDYLHLLLRSARFKSYYNQYSYGIRVGQWDMHYGDFKNLKIFIPPRAEQDQIVRFLDWKVSEINKLIGIRRKEIKELEKLCWIVIVNAISKVKQKNISEWKRVRVKQICRMQSGTNLISQVIDQSGNYPVYGGNGLRGYYKNYTNDGQYVIIGRQGALAGNVHLVEGRFWATDHAIVVYCSKFLIPRYAYYLFTGMNLNQYAFNAAAQPGLSVTKILNLQCDVPSVARQLEIADRLDEICIQLEKIVNNTKKKIKLLQELKSVIISDVVTGKIDVRNIPVPAYEHVDDLTADDGEGNDGETGIPGEED